MKRLPLLHFLSHLLSHTMCFFFSLSQCLFHLLLLSPLFTSGATTNCLNAKWIPASLFSPFRPSPLSRNLLLLLLLLLLPFPSTSTTHYARTHCCAYCKSHWGTIWRKGVFFEEGGGERGRWRERRGGEGRGGEREVAIPSWILERKRILLLNTNGRLSRWTSTKYLFFFQRLKQDK